MGKNRITGLHVPKIEHVPRETCESTRAYVFADKNKPSPQYRQVNQKSSVEIPAAQSLDENVKLRHYVVILTGSPEQKEIEIANPDAKIRVPEGAWGYEIRTKRVSAKGGQIFLENCRSSKVYVGKEITKAGLEESLEIVNGQIERLEVEKNMVKNMIQTMTGNRLERIVEVGSNKNLKMIALSEYDKVIPPESYHNS